MSPLPQNPPLEITDFSGGITDQYLPGPTNRYQRGDNLLINDNKKLYSRPGTTLYNSTFYQIPSGAQRVAGLINFDNNDELLFVSARNIYWIHPETGWQTLQGPTSNVALSAGADTAQVSSAMWQHVLYVTNDDDTEVMKIYRDESDVLRLRNAGLPELADTQNWVDATVLSAAITLANEMRTDFDAHYGDATAHLSADAVAGGILIAPAATNLATLLTLTTQLLTSYESHYRDSVLPLPAYHSVADFTAHPLVFPTTDKLSSTLTPTTLEEAVLRLNDLRKAFNHHDGNVYIHLSTVGTHLISSARVSDLTSGPTFSDPLADLLALANALKAQFNAHIASGGLQFGAGTFNHTAADNTIQGFADTTGINVGDYVFATGIPPGTTVTQVDPTSIEVDYAPAGSNVYAYVYTTAGDQAHTYEETDYEVTSADATDAASLATLVFELRRKYTYHMEESLFAGAQLHLGLFKTDSDISPVATPIPASHFLLDDGTLVFLPPPDQTLSLYDGLGPDQIDGLRAALIELKTKFNIHQQDVDQHYPDEAVMEISEFYVGGADPDSGTYLYGFVHKYSYFVGSVLFEDRGPVLLKQAIEVTKPEVKGLVISNIPVLANGTTHNYDTSQITIEIYRTTDNGSELYLVGEVTNGTTTFTDRTDDETLVTSTPIYTAGGVVDNDPPPIAKYLHITNGFAYYGHVFDTDGTELSNRVRQAIQDDPDSVPGDFYIDFDQDVTGLSSVKENPLVFCTDSSYRLEGFFNELGQGGIGKISISDTRGCVSHQSIVQTDEGVFFASNEGFCWTDGYGVKLVTDWQETYRLLVFRDQGRKIQGAYDKYSQRIYWSVMYGNQSDDNDQFYVMDLNFGVKEAMPFTTFSSDTDMAPTSLCVFDKEILFGDRRGYTFQFHDGMTTDFVVDTTLAPSLWRTKSVLYNYTSCGHDMGNSSIKKWGTRVTVRMKNRSDLSAQINSNNDDGRVVSALTPIKFRGHLTWGDAQARWRDPGLFWDYEGIVEDTRHFPADSLRFTYKQIQFRNAFVPIQNSDTIGLGTVAPLAKTITLVDFPTQTWPSGIESQYIAFEEDDYTAEYLILDRTSDSVITVQDTEGSLTFSGNQKWVIRGYPKHEYFEMLSYAIHTSSVGTRSQQAFVQSTGENA